MFQRESPGPPRPGLVAHRLQRWGNFAAHYLAVAEESFYLQITEPQKFIGADTDTPQIRSKGALNKYSDAFRWNLAKQGWIARPKIRADRDLGSGASSMIQTAQLYNRQSALFLDVLQGLGCERNCYVGRPSSGSGCCDRLAKPQFLDVKPRRHDVPALTRFPSPIPL